MWWLTAAALLPLASAYPQFWSSASARPGCFVQGASTLEDTSLSFMSLRSSRPVVYTTNPTSGSCRWSVSPSLSSGWHPSTTYTFTVTNPNSAVVIGSQGADAGSWSGGSGACSKTGSSCPATNCRGRYQQSSGTLSFSWTSPSSATGDVTIGLSCGQQNDMTTAYTTFGTAPPSQAPTPVPTPAPTTATPTDSPSSAAPSSAAPTADPTTSSPTATPTDAPTRAPSTRAPTPSVPTAPTASPTTLPPTNAPTASPTFAPTNNPTLAPTSAPTTATPTSSPTAPTTPAPTHDPTSAPTTASCVPTCDLTGAGSVSGAFAVRYRLQDAIDGCPDRVCFEVNLTDASKWRAVGLSVSGTSMGDFEKIVVGRVGAVPYAYHASPGGGQSDPSGSLVQSDVCISSVSLSGTVLRFARRLDGSTCTASSLVLSRSDEVSFAAVEGDWLVSAASPQLRVHVGRPRVASGVALASTTETEASEVAGASNADRRQHGTLMTVAWVCLTPVALFSARNMRDILGANGVWFKIHVLIQVVVAVITVAAIAALTDKTGNALSDGDFAGDKVHQRLGVSVLAMVLAQVLMGFLRNVISGKGPSGEGGSAPPPASGRNSASPSVNPVFAPRVTAGFELGEHNNEQDRQRQRASAQAAKQAGDTHDHGPRRWLFNLFHVVLGVTTWVVALAAVYKGFALFEKLNPEADASGMQTLLIVWAAVVGGAFASVDGARLATGEWSKFATPVPALWVVAGIVVVAASAIITFMIDDKLQDAV